MLMEPVEEVIGSLRQVAMLLGLLSVVLQLYIVRVSSFIVAVYRFCQEENVQYPTLYVTSRAKENVKTFIF